MKKKKVKGIDRKKRERRSAEKKTKYHILTMRQPHSRIICLPCNDEIACSGEHLDVSARRIFGLENCVGVCVGSGAGGEDEEVVAVEVDGVFVMMVGG